jgi:hypothetical protein
MYREKCKKHTQMTNLYNLLKGRAMRSQMQTAASDSVSHALNSLPGTRNEEMISMNRGRTGQQQSHHQTPSSRQFGSFRTDRHGIEQLHRHQRSGSGSSRGGGGLVAAAMPPPKRPFNNSELFFRFRFRSHLLLLPGITDDQLIKYEHHAPIPPHNTGHASQLRRGQSYEKDENNSKRQTLALLEITVSIRASFYLTGYRGIMEPRSRSEKVD